MAVLAAVAAERGCELMLSRRHARRTLSLGGVETGHGLYGAMLAFHVLFLLSAACEAVAFGRGAGAAICFAALVAAVGAQALRYWAVITLGVRWNTRIIALPGTAPVTGGPYRFVRHPNYLAVIIEMISVPMVYGCWRTALIFSCGNAVLLSFRIAFEERALGDEYARAFAGVPRFVPCSGAHTFSRTHNVTAPRRAGKV